MAIALTPLNFDTRASILYGSTTAVVMAGMNPDICPKLCRYGNLYYCGSIKKIIEDRVNESSEKSAFLSEETVEKFCLGNQEYCSDNNRSK
jgi:hypothetical protein